MVRRSGCCRLLHLFSNTEMTRPLLPGPSPLPLLPFHPLYTVLSCFTARYNPTGCLLIIQQASSWLFWTTNFCNCFCLFCFAFPPVLRCVTFSAGRVFFRPAHFFHTKERRRLFPLPNLLHLFSQWFSFFVWKSQLDYFESTLLALFTSWRFLERVTRGERGV